MNHICTPYENLEQEGVRGAPGDTRGHYYEAPRGPFSRSNFHILCIHLPVDLEYFPFLNKVESNG